MRKPLHFVLILGLIAFSVPAVSANINPLKVGVSPNGENSVSLAEFWIPFLDQLETESGVALRFATAPDLLEFNQRLSAGEYDLVVTDQYLFTIFRQKHKLSYLAELTNDQKTTDMVLVANSETKVLSHIEGGLLAVKQDEKASNITALDKHLSENGVTALRDNVQSYDKILQSIAEKLHVAGLVPVCELNNSDKLFSILWRTTNNHSYVMTFPQSTSRLHINKLTAALEKIAEGAETEGNASRVHVKSVRAPVQAGD